MALSPVLQRLHDVQLGIDRVRTLLQQQAAIAGVQLQLPPSPLIQFVDGTNGWAEAKFDPTETPLIGIGRDGASPDMGAHEFTHLVVHANCDFGYAGHPSSRAFDAINEGVADVIAALADGDWQIGDTHHVIRDIERGAGILTSMRGARGLLRFRPTHLQSGLVSRVAYLASRSLDTPTLARVFARLLAGGLDPMTDYDGFGAALLRAATAEGPAARDAMLAALTEVGYTIPAST